LRLWGAPIALGALSAVGLITALLDDGIGDVLSWVTLAVPVAVIVWYLRPSFRRSQSSPE